MITAITIILSVAGTSGAVWAFAKKVWPVIRKIVHVLDDWLGREQSPGHDAHPGVMERLRQIEQVQISHTEAFEVVLHELFPNSGSSLRDGMDRAEADISEIKRLIHQQNGA